MAHNSYTHSDGLGEKVRELVIQGYSVRKIAKKLGLPKSTTHDIIKRLNLKTSRAKRLQYHKREKVVMNIAFSTSVEVDITSVDIKPQKKHKSSVGFYGIASLPYRVIWFTDNPNRREIIHKYFTNVIKDKALTIGCDKEFAFMKDFGYQVFKLQKLIHGKVISYHALVSDLERLFGTIKSVAYDRIFALKKLIKLTDKDLLTSYKYLVLKVYVETFKEYGFTVKVDVTPNTNKTNNRTNIIHKDTNTLTPTPISYTNNQK